MKILYVCHSAHRPSHYPFAVLHESMALRRLGAEVFLCTFSGILDGDELNEIVHIKVTATRYGYSIRFISYLLSVLKLKPLVGFLEQFSTLFLAVRLRKRLGYDVIYLRDGDLFIFIPFLFGLFTKRIRLAISMIGVVQRMSHDSLPYKFINSSLWKPIYRRSLYRNRFVILCQNTYIEDYFKTSFLGGMLSKDVQLFNAWVSSVNQVISQKDARAHLGLGEGKLVILSFGALHGGKDIETVIHAMKEIPDIILMQAGKVTSSVDVQSMVRNLGLQDKVVINDYYIPESEKGYYFAAADAVILSYKKDFMQTASMLWEAAAYRLPVIASDFGELGVFVQRYDLGLVFKAEDIESLKEMLLRFFNYSQDKKMDLTRQCDKFCDEYAIEKWAQRFMDISGRLCNK